MKPLFGASTDKETPHVVGPKPGDVLAQPEQDQNFFLPLLSIDLSVLDPTWIGKISFVYNEHNTEGGVSFRLDQDGKYVFLGESVFDEDDMASRDRRKGFWQLVDAAVDSVSHQNISDVMATLHAVEKRDGLESRSLAPKNFIGGAPCWTQHDETPKDPDGDGMIFIGQIVAMDFSDEVGDKDLYLFYSPKHRLVTQIDQQT